MRLFNRIAFKLTVSSAALMIVFGAIFTIYFTQREEKIGFVNARNKLRSLGYELTLAASHLFETADIKNMQNYTMALATHEGMAHIAVIDKEFKVIADSRTEHIGRPTGTTEVINILKTGEDQWFSFSEGGRNYLRFAAPILKKLRSIVRVEDIIGVVLLDIDISRVIVEARERTRQAIFFFITGIAGIVTVIFFLTFTMVIRPLLKLKSAAQAFAKGDYTARADLKSKDEVGDLAATFNKMAEDLNHNINGLKESRQKLETSNKELKYRENIMYGLIVDLDRAKQTLAEKAAELARSNADLEQFAYVASHDLKEPLRMIFSYVQLLEQRYKGRLDKDADDFIHFAVDGAKRMQALINDLLEYSRVTTRARPFAPCDCNMVLNWARENLILGIQENSATISSGPLPEIMADATQVMQLFQNLIANSIKFKSEEPPHIHISCLKQDKEWLFSFKDNGIGFDKQYAERIFQIFQRLHTREEYPGTGIGLAIAKKIIEHHGGRIWAESKPGQGAVFYFTIPVS